MPEIPFTFENICGAIRARELRGKRFSLIVVAEGVKLPTSDPEGEPIPPKEIRVTVLGHVQPGGSPTPLDRILGTRFAVAATELVARQELGGMVCLKAGRMDSVSLDEAPEKMKFIDPNMEIVHAARAVGATFGDGR